MEESCWLSGLNSVVWVDAHRGAGPIARILADNGVHVIIAAVHVTIQGIILIMLIVQAAFGVQ